MRTHRRQLNRRFHPEPLERRDVPATWGVPWPQAEHLTLSFMPDGSSVDGQSSQLFQLLDGQLGAGKWEQTILDAFQTWAENSNINIGQVADGGQPFGVAGPTQGDAQFGDIRVSAIPLPAGVVAITSPYSAGGGTAAGDMILNSNLSFNSGPGYDLFTVALHEAGHSFGFADSPDPSSFMYDVYTGPQAGLAPGAVAALQALYGGPRDIVTLDGDLPASDPARPANVTSLLAAAPGSNATAGDLASPGSAAFYQLKLASYGLTSAGITVQVQTAGISQLIPRVTVTDQSGNVVASAVAAATTDGGVSAYFLPAVGKTYYLKVDGPTGDLHSVGSYLLSVAPTWATSSTAAGMSSATSIDAKGSSSQATAIGSAQVTATTQVDYYAFTTPTLMPAGFTAQLQAFGVGLTAPTLEVLNAKGVVVGQATASDPTSPNITVRITSPIPNAKYYLRATTGVVNSYQAGVYQVSASFGGAASPITPILATPWLGSIDAKLSTPNTAPSNPAVLQTPAGYVKGSFYAAMQGIGTKGTANYFDISLPKAKQQAYMTVAVQAINGSNFVPWVQVTDKAGNLVPAQVLAQSGGISVIQVPYSPGTSDNFVKVAASAIKGGGVTGNYLLNVTFGAIGSSLATLSAGTIGPVAASSTATPVTTSLATPSASLYEFVLAGDPSNAGSDAMLRLTVTDAGGNVVATLATMATEAASLNVILGAGQYSIAVDDYSPSNAALPTILYNLAGTNLTDPIKVYPPPGSGGSGTTY